MSSRFRQLAHDLRKWGCRMTGHPLKHFTVGTDRTDRIVSTAVVKYCDCLYRMEVTGFGRRRA